jgi:Type IV secretion-system coupling protein DNA-binding domain/TraM recognition site of TraD and TraG
MARNSNNREPFAWIGIDHEWQHIARDYRRQLVKLTAEDLRTHLYVIGSTGSGKTTLIHNLIAQDVARGHSLCIIDLRGDLVNTAIRICSSRLKPSEIALIDLRECDKPMGYNPLFGVGEPHIRALGVYSVLEAMSTSWGVQLGQDLRYALLLLAEAGGSLVSVRRVMTDRRFLSECLSKCSNDEVADHWRRFDALPPDQREARLMPVTNKLSGILATPSLRKMFGHSAPIDLGKHLDNPGSVTLVSLAVDELHDVGRMVGRMFLASVCRERFGKAMQSEKSRNPVRIYADEFENLGYTEFEHILSEGRRFGLSCVLSHQTSSQISPKVRSLILGNCGAKIAFRCGREDSALVSKDLTGDPYELDLTSLEPGEACVWTRDLGVVEIETNAPLFDDAAEMPPEASRFRSLVLENRQSDTVPQIAVQGASEQPKKRNLTEDWLCD